MGDRGASRRRHRPHRIGPVLLLAACRFAVPDTVAGPEPASAPDASAFWAHWGDGKAEVSSYDLVQPRYGALSRGDAVLIFVTEDFSWSERVKADPGQHPDADIRKVLKLNAVRNFDTGIYTYHVMTSVFSRVDPGDGMAMLSPIKLTFSAQEWCGMVYDQWVMAPGSVHLDGGTYFDGDTRPPSTLPLPDALVYGDAVPLLIRGLRGDWVAPGASVTVPYLPTALDLRFAHEAAAPGRATVSRGASTPVDTVLGAIPAEPWTIAVEGGATTTWTVETASPHRILGWRSDQGELATLRGSDRLPYWMMNHPDDLRARARVGLPIPPPASQRP
jgi:hypothetical protein